MSTPAKEREILVGLRWLRLAVFLVLVGGAAAYALWWLRDVLTHILERMQGL